MEILHYVLTHEPDNVRRVGNSYYLKDHDSLEISNGLWHWRSRGIGGRNVVDYLIKVRGYSFVDAVRRLSGGVVDRRSTSITRQPTQERKRFALPVRHYNNDRVIAYLRSRGIDKQLILDCLARRILFESARYHNCVFVGRDENGKARQASLRGTMSGFKCDAEGSDKRFGFILPPNDGMSDVVAVFESPVDALSHTCLFPDFEGWRLSLGGTALMTLAGFLERHGEVRHCIVCTDRDEAGELAAAKIAELPNIAVSRDAPPYGKDWNDTLLAVHRVERSRGRATRELERSG